MFDAAASRMTAGAPIANVDLFPFKTNLGWDDVEFIRKSTDLPIVLKGVLSPALARQAVERGCAGVQVSNHGGRQMDGMRASIDVLGGIVDAVDGRIAIVVDGGFRRGADIFTALALGADAVGRPPSSTG